MSLYKKKISLVIGSVILASIIFLVTFANSNDSNDTPTKNELTTNVASEVYIPSNIKFCNEPVPLHDFDVLESLERELLVNVFWQSQTIQFVKYVHRYFPIMDSIFKIYNIPTDFKYLALAESGLKVNISPKGAAGFWQFLDGTAKQYGLTVSEDIDERYDIEKSTEAACKYLKTAYAKFGNWTLVAASYNLGIGGLSGQMNYQKIDSYYDLHTNSETGRYVFRIIALKLILENPEKYGYGNLNIYRNVPFKRVAVDSTISNLSDFAKSQGSNYKLLKMMNPWLRGKTLPNASKKTYKIIIITNSDRITSKQ